MLWEPQSDDEGCTAPDTSPMRVGYASGGDDGCIAESRHHTADFLTRLRDEHDLDVSPRALDLIQLVVSELVTDARTYAPGPVLVELRIIGASAEVVVRDSDPTVPVAHDADTGRVGQHGLEIGGVIAGRYSGRRRGRPDGRPARSVRSPHLGGARPEAERPCLDAALRQ